MTYRMTHIDLNGHRHCAVLRMVANVSAATAWMEPLYGMARYQAAVRLDRWV